LGESVINKRKINQNKKARGRIKEQEFPTAIEGQWGIILHHQQLEIIN